MSVSYYTLPVYLGAALGQPVAHLLTQEHDAQILWILKRVLFRGGGNHRFRPAFLGARKVRQLQRTLVGRNPSLDRGINDHSSNDRAQRRDGEMVVCTHGYTTHEYA